MYNLKVGIGCLATALIILGSCTKVPIAIPESPLISKTLYASPVTKKIADKVNLVKTVVADSLFDLAPGVKYTKIF